MMATEEIYGDRNSLPVANSSFFDLSDLAENIELTSGALKFTPDGLRALGGNDTVIGSSDSEILYGNAGNDLLHGEVGNDLLMGGLGNDKIYGEDTLKGDKGNDFISGGNGNDLLVGGQGDDQYE